MMEFKHLERALKDYADAIRDEYKDNLEKNNRRATGQLITSINTKIVVDGNTFEIELQLADYWRYIEEGRNPTTATTPSTPTLQECILDWIRVKQILPHPDKNGKLPTEEELSYMIADKIHREGYEGSHDLEDALKEVDYDHIIEEALDKDVIESIDEIMMILGK